MNLIFGYLVFGFMILLGGIPSVFLVVALPVIIVWKIYRKIKYGYKITD